MLIDTLKCIGSDITCDMHKLGKLELGFDHKLGFCEYAWNWDELMMFRSAMNANL